MVVEANGIRLMVIDSSFYQTCIDAWLGDVNLTLELVWCPMMDSLQNRIIGC